MSKNDCVIQLDTLPPNENDNNTINSIFDSEIFQSFLSIITYVFIMIIFTIILCLFVYVVITLSKLKFMHNYNNGLYHGVYNQNYNFYY